MDAKLIRLVEEFGSENKCRAYLEKLRWPEGVRCPRCTSERISRIKKRNQFDCNNCRHQFSVTAGTLFGDSHLPLWKWFMAAYVMCESKRSVSALQLKRILDVSYKTAWYLCHRIRAAMMSSRGRRLAGGVEINETHAAGRGYGVVGRGPKERGAVVGIVERGRDIRMRMASDLSTDAILRMVQERVSPKVMALYMDESARYGALRKVYLGKAHGVRHATEWIRGNMHTDVVEGTWSLLERSILGPYHGVSIKHLPAYLEEAAFRYNNRKNPRLFQVTLKRLLDSEPLEFTRLTRTTAWS